jgi:hypothetical protein
VTLKWPRCCPARALSGTRSRKLPDVVEIVVLSPANFVLKTIQQP